MCGAGGLWDPDLAGGGATFHIKVPKAMRSQIAIKDSICVSGVCLTATDLIALLSEPVEPVFRS